MSMRLTIIGGAAAWPNAGQGCSAYLLRSAQTQILMDCGPDTLQELRRHVDYLALDAIVISHCHADHFLDLAPYRYGLVYGAVRPRRPIPLWMPPGGIATLNAVASALGGDIESPGDFWSKAFDVREYAPAERLELGDLRIAFERTQHPVPCYAMRVVDDAGASLFFSADTGDAMSLVGLARDADLALVEATTRGDDTTPPERRVHLTPRQAGEFATAARVRTLVLTHLWSERDTSEVRREAAAVFSGRTEIARPGLTVDARAR
jgi:ribonuclease BN (tRNA processing enzyme)